MYSSLKGGYDDKYAKSQSVFLVAQRYIQTIASQPETSKVFWFLLLNMSFTVVEFVYGYITNSLGLTGAVSQLLIQQRTRYTCSLIQQPLFFHWLLLSLLNGIQRLHILMGMVKPV